MAQTSGYNTNALYFTEKLKTRLRNIPDFPLTILVAPVGHGKTTALRSTLQHEDFKVLWQTVYGGGASYFWSGFCEALSPLSADLADNLRHMGLPSDVVFVQKAVALIRNTKVADNTFLVIDDYHFVNSQDIDKFIAFLLANLPLNLRMVITSRTSFLPENITELRLKGIVNYIATNDFLLQPDDIAKYYALCGITITNEEQNRLFRYSEGWITPLYLSLLEYVAHGRFTASGDVVALVHNMVYKPLRDELKEFLTGICLFDSFNIKQVQHMWPQENVAQLLDELSLKNAFISKDNTTGNYTFHNLFASQLRDVFDLQPVQVQNELWERAGHWYLNNKEFIQAMDCFDKADNFLMLLTVLAKTNVTTLTGEHQEKIIDYYDRCPQTIKNQNLVAMIVFIYLLISYNEPGRLKAACATFEQNIVAYGGTIEEKNRLIMHYERFISLTKYNNIMEMSKHHRKALSYMDKQPAMMMHEVNWTFGSPSILLMFYRESGKLAEHLLHMKECMPIFYRLTDGRGHGAEYVMEAEAAFNMGEIEKAESTIHKGLHYAREKNQWGILLAASFLQIRLALMRGDYFEATFLKKQMLDIMESKKQYVLLHTLDICESYFYLLLNIPERTTEWIASGHFTHARILFPAQPALHIVYGRYLLLTGQYLKLIGLVDIFIEVSSVYPNLIGQIYAKIYLAAVHHRLSHKDAAINHLKEALDMACPDKVYMPFAENGDYVADLLQELANQVKYGGHVKPILSLYKKHSRAVQQVKQMHFIESTADLTSREYEVAILAAAGLSNREIAKKIFISESTVKARLKVVFEKLSIKSRVQLNALLENEKR